MAPLHQGGAKISTVSGTSNVVYEELKERDDIVAYFHLRYEEYLNAGYVMNPNSDHVDADPYDFFARYVGAFSVENGKKKLIAGVRMIEQNNATPLHPVLEEICSSFKTLNKLPRTTRVFPFQLMQTVDVSPVIKECQEQSRSLVEFNRTVVDHEYQRTGVGLHVVNNILNFAARMGKEVGLGCCRLKLQHFYESSGCKIIGTFYHSVHHQMHALLKIDLAERFRQLQL